MSCCFVPYYVLSRGGGNSSDSGMKTERVQDQKEKMLVELQALWTEQCDQLRKKKEQFATEVSKTCFPFKMRKKDISGGK